MFYIILAIAFFIVAVMLHILFCRQTIKEGLHAKAFIIIAFIFLALDGGIVFFVHHAKALDPQSLWGLPFQWTSAAIYILLIPVYLCFYILTQQSSPSKKILVSIAKQGELSYQGILAAVQEEDFIMIRLNDLCASGCVRQNNGRYILTSEGQKIAGILNIMQMILGRKVGG